MRSHSALSTLASTVAAIVILVLAIGGYFLLSQGGPASTTQPSSQRSTASTSGVTSGHNPVYYSWQLGRGFLISLPDLLGNYSQMAFSMSTKGLNYSESANETWSYDVVGHPVLNGSVTTEVVSNSTLTAYSNGTRLVDDSVDNVVWMASNGSVVQASENGRIKTGAAIGAPDSLITPVEVGGPFYFAADILSLNATLVSAVNSSSGSIGPTQMALTVYQPTSALAFSPVLFGFGYSVTVETGIAQGTSFYVPVSINIFGPPLLNGFHSTVALTTITLASVTKA